MAHASVLPRRSIARCVADGQKALDSVESFECGRIAFAISLDTVERNPISLSATHRSNAIPRSACQPMRSLATSCHSRINTSSNSSDSKMNTRRRNCAKRSSQTCATSFWNLSRFYCAALDEQLRLSHENPSLGLVLRHELHVHTERDAVGKPSGDADTCESKISTYQSDKMQMSPLHCAVQFR